MPEIGKLYQDRTFSKEELTQRLREKLRLFSPEIWERFGELFLEVKSEVVFDVLQMLNRDFLFDYLKCMTAVDRIDYLELVYCIYSFDNAYSLTVKTKLPADSPRAKSVTSIWKGADWHEREIHDLFGIVFEGHSNLKKLILWDGFDEHPLRKSFRLELPTEESEGEI